MTTIKEALKQLQENNNPEIITESKADDIYNQYYSNMERADFDAIWNADPTGNAEVKGKFVQWLLNKHKKGDNVLGQLSRIKKAINTYTTDKNKFNKALGTNDINGLDLNTFLTIVENTDKTAFRQFLEETGEVVTTASSKNYDVFHPLSREGNSYIIGEKDVKSSSNQPHDLNWCTGYDHSGYRWRSYGEDYYCFIWKKDRTDKPNNYQINVKESNGIKDIEYFLDGSDNRPANGGENYKECFIIFLVGQPDLLEELMNTHLKEVKSIRDASEILKAQKENKPLKYSGEFLLPLAQNYLRSIIEKIEIEDGVKQVKPNIFANFVNLKEVDFPSSVEVICARAFCGCTSLGKIDFKEGLKDIRALAFLGDNSLKRVDLPDSLQRMDVSAFKDCPDVVLRINNKDGNRYLEVGGNLTEDDYRWLRKHVKQIRQ